MPLPVFLELREVLAALFRHAALVDFVLVVAHGAAHLAGGRAGVQHVKKRTHAQSSRRRTHLQRIQMLHRLDGRHEVGKLGDRRQALRVRW